MVLRVRSRSSSVVVGVSFRRVEEGGEERRRKKRHVNIMMKWKLEFYAGAFKVFCFVFFSLLSRSSVGEETDRPTELID